MSAQLLTFKNYDHKDGLHMASISCITQSEDGMIWLGSDGGGLIQFDGASFSEINLENKNNHHYKNVIIDGDEVLFASLYSGFYSYSQKSKKLSKFNLDNMVFGDALRIFKKQGFHYFVGSRQIISRKKKTKKLMLFESNENRLQIFQSFETPNSIFILTNFGGYRLSNGEIQKLSDWSKNINDITNSYHFGSYSDGLIKLLHAEGTEALSIKVDSLDSIISSEIQTFTCSLENDEKINSYTYNSSYNQPTILTDKGNLFFLVNNDWRKVPHNFSKETQHSHSLYSDLNGDYWALSFSKGIYKISKDPFTKIELSDEYTDPYILYNYAFDSGIILISNNEGKTYIESSPNSHEFIEYNFSTHGITEINGIYYIATNKGLKTYSETASPKIATLGLRRQSLNLVFSHSNQLWIGISTKGIAKYNLKSNDIEFPTVYDGRMPSHAYTAQLSSDRKKIYFGTNGGVYTLDIKQNKLKQLHINDTELGSYCGISTKDAFGNNWFSLESGIIVITKDKKIRIYKGSKYFNSTLFYTLIADDLGNIIVGTNKGLTIFKVDKDANIVSKNIYNEETNFLGYETHMRSQFKKGNEILIGTVEGLFQINTEFLGSIPTPLKPHIFETENATNSDDPEAYNFSFSLINPKINSITYSYQLNDKEWVILKKGDHSLLLTGLSSGQHQLKVKASYDGVHFGGSSLKQFNVEASVWRSTWFIAGVIASLFILNLILLNYYKAFSGERLINTKDLNVHLNLTPAILLFASITALLANILAPIMSPELKLNLGPTLATSFILFSLYLSSLSAKSNKKTYLYDAYLKIGLIVVLADFLWEVFDSKLHPYNIIGVVLISTIAPYILSKVKDTFIFSIALILVSVIFISVIENPVYPRFYYLMSISIISFLTIFYSYLRYDSLEKLIFVSAIINKGNMPVIAFNKSGTVTYSSENISSFLNISHSEILDKNITVLNNFIPFDSSFKEKDITKEFQDGEKYLAPMIDQDNKVRWMEWAYRDFSENVKLILGQDVSEKMTLENTYELLVQHAEDFIYKCDNKGNFNFINNISYARLGYTKDELLHSNSLRIVHPSYREEVITFYRDHFINKNMTSYKEFPILKKNGEQIWVGQSITTLYSPGSTSQVDGFIALARDITDIRNQQEVIIEQSNSITSSINYARRIQHNLLPVEQQFKEAFKEHFIFSRPKDIVSGDFYWMEKVGNNTILVLGDCTGHGVPGSFMTLLGFNLLNSTVLENRITDPGKILNKLDRKLIEYLPRGEGKNLVHDAMELTVCVFNDTSNEMAYACAGSRFLIHESGDFTMFKGDNKHAGDIEENFLGYNTHFANFTSDYNLFLFSDGFQDQFGGAKDKKYSFRRLLELFEENVNLPFDVQQKLIAESFDKWIGKTEQTDDVTVVSVKRGKISE